MCVCLCESLCEKKRMTEIKRKEIDCRSVCACVCVCVSMSSAAEVFCAVSPLVCFMDCEGRGTEVRQIVLSLCF